VAVAVAADSAVGLGWVVGAEQAESINARASKQRKNGWTNEERRAVIILEHPFILLTADMGREQQSIHLLFGDNSTPYFELAGFEAGISRVENFFNNEATGECKKCRVFLKSENPAAHSPES